jgi:uncharacterized ferritin-like protein (DUF455 family)
MEASELAQRILFGDSLEDKLVDGGRILDRKPGTAQSTPDQPGRPPDLRLDSWQGRERVRFNDVRRFNSDKERGLVLHFFANHELLALELLALALLKFPDAPPKFRRGLIATLKDEQKHLGLYIERMKEIGVGFGEIPVSDFFWRSISGMETPLDFVTRLSLTLEQANLDYAPHYRDLYKTLGDEATAALMGLVYRDEIRHVRYGLNWFETWRDPSSSQWQAYCDSLSNPLTPNRAKGIGFNVEGRRRAGLSDEFIGELEMYSRSRGRTPSVYWFNPTCDQEAGLRTRYTPTKKIRAMARDLACLPMYLGAGDDTVLVPVRPTIGFLRALKDAGLAIPEFVAYGEDSPKGEDSLNLTATGLADRRLQSLRPWGWSPEAERTLGPLFANLPEGHRSAPEQEAMRGLHSKSWSVELLKSLLSSMDDVEDWICDSGIVGEVCTSHEQVRDCVDRLWATGHSQVVIKGPFGAAGQDQIRLAIRHGSEQDSFEARMTGAKTAWLQRLLRDFGEVVVEPWLAGRIDLSAQFMSEPDRPIRFLGMTRFVTDARGQYVGSFIHQKVAGLDENDRRFLYGEGPGGKRLQNLFEHLGMMIKQQTDSIGYYGPIGVDALVYDAPSGRLKLKPVIEVNPRYTMGHLALKLAPRVNASRTALWAILRAQDMVDAGFDSIADFAVHMERTHPCQMTDGGLISRGILFTSDPTQAQAYASLLVVGHSLEQCMGYFESFGGRLGQWTKLWV